MPKTGIRKVLGRDHFEVRPYYNRAGRDKDGKPIFQQLSVMDFTGKPLNKQ